MKSAHKCLSWINQNLPPKSDNINSINLCPSSSSSQPSLKLSINNPNHNSYVSLSIFADYNLPVFLWTSKKILPDDNDNDALYTLVANFIEDVLKYCPNKSPFPVKIPRTYSENDNLIKDIFNFSFLSLTFVICTYEAPTDLRGSCLDTLKDNFACPKSRGVSKLLMRVLEIDRAANSVSLRTLSPLFSYSVSTFGLWKVQLYCPVMAMNVDKCNGGSADDRLLFSLNYHQLEVRCHQAPDGHSPPRTRRRNFREALPLTNISADHSGDPAGQRHKHISEQILRESPREIGLEKGVEASFQPPNAVGLHFSAGETVTTSLKPWKFEQSVYGNTAILNWFLHDSVDGREVFSSKPSKLAMLHPKAWFKNRYSSAQRPFTRQGGVIFAGMSMGEMKDVGPWEGRQGLGKGGAKRHRKVLRDNIQGITKPAIRRLARRGGVKRISGLIYEETRGVLKIFLENVIRDAVTYTEHARRKTVTAMDVVYALKRQGRTLYGFGG
ncbi:UNVERIFIED_CONTAM: Histone H4 variant [Sesamum calycinum]|uniref:Histone H4 n=1 Tax=Sesamum calycinum TaxID=2727403 RepID=A0AAW2LU77_9LAMI